MTTIARHRTAIGRSRLSKPVRLALELGLAGTADPILDYGCGRGDDVRNLRALGYTAAGWDPAHRPDGEVRPSALVNLGYVLNVIERPAERADTLRRAWELAEQVLVVSTLVSVDAGTRAVPYGDGIVTSRGTFQKVFEQTELEHFIRTTTGVDPVAIGMGIFAVCRDRARTARLLSSRYRHRTAVPDTPDARRVFEQNREALEPLVQFVQDRGRFPSLREHAHFSGVAEKFGNLKRALGVVKSVAPEGHWQAAAEAARTDILVYLALARLGGRPRFSQLDETMQEDVRAFFRNYAQAEREADALLFGAGKRERLREEVRKSPVGKLLADGLYVHVTAVPILPAVLRVYEGCATRYVGGVEGATLVKLRLDSPIISYLSYPDFDSDAHPALTRSLRIDLQTFRVQIDDYSARDNPPILHRKELFVAPDYPGRDKFARLTGLEERHGLLGADTHRIGTRNGWLEVLHRHGLMLKGHRLLRAEGGRHEAE